MEERESRGMVEHERICERSAGDRGEAVAGGRAWVGVDTVIPETLYILHFGLSDVSMIERFLRSVDQLFRALSIDYPEYQLKQ